MEYALPNLSPNDAALMNAMFVIFLPNLYKGKLAFVISSPKYVLNTLDFMPYHSPQELEKLLTSFTCTS